VGNEWFETVREARRRAKKRLPHSVYLALIAGSERGVTLRDNVAAFDEIELAPHIVDLVTDQDTSTTVLGQRLAMPVMISPTGVQAVHPDGELAVARATAARGVAMGLGAFGSRPVEDVVAENPATLYQTYWSGSRDDILTRITRAKRAGAAGLIVTLDWSFSHSRDWGSPSIPSRMDLKTMLRFAPEVVLGGKFRYLADFARAGGPPDLKVPNSALPGQDPPGFFEAYGEWMGTPQPTWDDIAWLREQWGDGPFMVKGILRVDDAKAAVDAGASAISVSNHGGNNLDGAPAALRVLPSIVDAVGDDVEVLMDGGIRRGSDVLKAVALGARAVLIGRAYLWGLAANGQAGVENVLDLMHAGLRSGMMGLRRGTIHELSRDDLLVPPGFTRTLGGPDGHRIGEPALHRP
jgi:pre-mycofactocin synthase